MPDQIDNGIITQPTAFARVFKIFAPAPAVPIKSTDPVEVSKQYGYWRRRVLFSSIIAAVIGTLLFILAWPAKADGYDSPA